MSCLSRFRLITFDATDTLIKLRTAKAKQYGEIGAMFGVLYDDNNLIHNFKFNWHRMHRIHPNFGLKTKIGYEEWWKQLLEGTFSDNEENKISDEKLTKMTNYLLEIYKTTTCWSLCYGALDFLNYLKLQQQFESQAGKNEPHFRMGVISNFDDRLDVLLRNMKINHYFEFVLSSYRAGFEKPDQEIFKEAMKQSGLKDLKPSECLHIGDTPITDYFGARQAGWYSILIHDKSPEQLKKKYGSAVEDNHVLTSLYDLHKKISNDYMKW